MFHCALCGTLNSDQDFILVLREADILSILEKKNLPVLFFFFSHFVVLVCVQVFCSSFQ